MAKKDFVSVRMSFYKTEEGKKEIAHTLRLGVHADNENVTFKDDQSNNIYTFDESKFDELEQRHRDTLGRKPQGNRNAVIEHVIVFSEDKFNDHTPEAHKQFLDDYMEKIKEEYGFEPMGFGIHMDEGSFKEDGTKKRNTHAHVYFYNYDFKKKKAPLRDLMAKGKNEAGQLNKLNPNFVKMQDIAAEAFKPLGYRRGISKANTGLKHRKKEAFVEDKIKEKKKMNSDLIKENIKQINENIKLNDENRALIAENKELKASNQKLATQVKQWVKQGLEYVKKSLEGFKATDEAEKTLEKQPAAIDYEDAEGFYNELEEVSGNDEIRKVRKKKRGSKYGY